VERAIDLRREIGQGAAGTPGARTREAVVGEHFDRAAGGGTAFTGGADAVGQGGQRDTGTFPDEPGIVARAFGASERMTGGVDVHGASLGALRGVGERLQMRAAARAPQVVRQRVFTSRSPMSATPQRPAKSRMPVT
jgi:hypothetical protein